MPLSSRSRAAKWLSATKTRSRSGSHRPTRRIRCQARSVKEDRPTGQRPDAVRPRQGSQHPPGEPAPATDLHKMRVGGASRVAGEALGGALLAAAAFASVLQAHNDDTPPDAHRHQDPEQQPTGGERRPDSPAEDAVIRLKVRRGAAAHDLEPGAHRPLAWGENAPSEEDFGGWPHRSGKDGCKDAKNTGEGDRERKHDLLSVCYGEKMGGHYRSILPHIAKNGQSRAEPLSSRS